MATSVSNSSSTTLTYQDKKTILAASLGIREWNIDDLDDKFVYYTQESSSVFPRGNFKRSYTISNNTSGGRQVSFGDPMQIVKRTIFEPLVVVGQFSLEDEQVEFSDDGMVLRTGKIFEAGDYPDKGFSITEQELADAAVNFTPVDNDIEHQSTILDGQLGQLVKVDAKGKALFGTVKIPKWLNDSLGSDPLKVSLAWAKNTKRIIKNALVTKPRIPDAQLVAAFNAANSNTGGVQTQMDTQDKEKKPGFWERIRAHFKDGKLPDVDEAELNQAQFASEPKPEPAEQKKEEAAKQEAKPEAAFSAELEGLRTAQLKTEAERFAEDAIKLCKAFPAERANLVAQFTQAAKDDNAGVACFSTDGTLNEGSRVKMLKESIKARPTHNLTSEQITGAIEKGEIIAFACGGSGSDGDANTPTPKGKEMSAARKAKLKQQSGISTTKEGK